MATIQQATERLTAARAAYRAELSPVMTRDVEKRDRLAAEVDAAAAELWLAEYAVEPETAIAATDFADVVSRAACDAATSRYWYARAARHEAAGLTAVAAQCRRDAETDAVHAVALMLDWLATLPAVDDCRDLDFSAAAMATSSTRARATRRAA